MVTQITIGNAPSEKENRGYFPPSESQGGWRKLENPDDIRQLARMDPDKLDQLKQWLKDSDNRNFAAVVIRNGYIVLEVERGNSAKTDSRRVASVSKAVCATVLAIASEQSQQGLTPRKMSFDDLAFQFIPWAQPLSDPRKENITVKQLLNHTSGICPEATGAPNKGTWEYILGHSGDERTAKLAFDPGTACGYSTHALAHASLVCETVTGKPYDQFAIETLFKPIGCEHWWFQYYDGGDDIGRHPSHSMGMPARDLARIAYCMMRNGKWNEEQVIPKWFVEQTSQPTHDVKTLELRFRIPAQTFSHGWQLPARLTGEGGTPTGKGIPADARYKPGSGGQLIAFVPSLDLVVTRQTGSSGQWEYAEYLRRACAAVLPEQIAGQDDNSGMSTGDLGLEVRIPKDQAASTETKSPTINQNGILWSPYLEWELPNSSWSGNPFDVIAQVTFVHAQSGETHITEMFYDGGDTWKFRFTGTRLGVWTFTTESDDPELDGHSGTVIVEPNPNPEAHGFMTSIGSKWARYKGNDRRIETFAPQYAMYLDPDDYCKDPDRINADIQTFISGHGFSGFHTVIGCRWFDINQSDYNKLGADPNPDSRTFEALELLITKVHAAGGVVHIWAWGDDQRQMTPVKWGKNGAVDRRLQRYIAARLGTLPGWSMGYGFDLQEWVVRDDLRKWHEYMHQHLGWFHFLSGRGIGPAVYDPKEAFPQPAPHYYEGLDYSAYDQMRPGYDAYVASIEASPDKPSLSEDRFRIRPASCGHAGKDYDEEMTRRGLWHTMMAGGVANIWANLSPDCGGTSKPYQHPEWIKTCAMFFRTRFLADMHPGNDLTDFRNGSSLTDSTLNCCLQDAMNTHYIFYKEDAQSIRMDLSGMAEKQPAVAVDTKKPYREISLGILNSANQTWQAPYQSDWAIAVGEYPKIP